MSSTFGDQKRDSTAPQLVLSVCSALHKKIFTKYFFKNQSIHFFEKHEYFSPRIAGRKNKDISYISACGLVAQGREKVGEGKTKQS